MNSGPDSLARGAAPASPGTLHARTVTGGIKVAPRAGLTVRFGRGERPDVDLPVGEDDLRVSRRHGELTFRKRQWWLRNTGRQLVRLPHGRLMHLSTEPIPLAAGYTPVFVKGSGFREHLVELFVTGHDEQGAVPRRRAATLPPKVWPLDEDERLLLVVMGQHYLLYEDGPRPLTYHQTAEQLAYLRPGDEVERAADRVPARVAAAAAARRRVPVPAHARRRRRHPVGQQPAAQPAQGPGRVDDAGPAGP